MADVICKHWKVSRFVQFLGASSPRWGLRGVVTSAPRNKYLGGQTWRQYYGNLIGIADIRNANDKVTQKANSFLESLDATHQQQSNLSNIWKNLHSTRYYALCTSTVRKYFPPTLVDELSLYKREQNVQRLLHKCNEVENRRFLNLQAELHRNYVEERRRHFHRLGWVVFACLVGAGIGVSGAYLSDYLWYYFFRDDDATAIQPSDVDVDLGRLRHIATTLSDSMQTRSREFILYLSGLHSSLRNQKLSAKLTLPPAPKVSLPPPVVLADKDSELFPTLSSDVVSRMHHQSAEMSRLIKELKLLMDIKVPSVLPTVPSPVVVIEPVEEEPSNSDSIWKTTLVYAVILMLIPVALGESLS